MKTVSAMKELLTNKKLNESFSSVYTEDAFDTQYERFLDVLNSFEKRFSKEEDREVSLFSAPGRTEICGNHTDHNHGLVLAASTRPWLWSVWLPQISVLPGAEKREISLSAEKRFSKLSSTLRNLEY